MRAAASELQLLEPRSLREALRMLRENAPLAPIAGCTDVMVGINLGIERRRRFLNLWGLNTLRRIASKGDAIRIGAVCTYSQMIRSELVRARLPMLVAASRVVGGVQIQNRGTLGGNIANGSPAGDTLPVLAALEATVVLQSLDRTRRVPFTEFYTGYRQSVRRPDELIVAVEVPRVDGAQWFRKVGTRQAMAISKVVMAAVRAPEPRVALGSIAPTVLRMRRTEAALARGVPIAEARRILESELAPIDDVRSTAAYRRRVSGNLLARFWTDTARVRMV